MFTKILATGNLYGYMRGMKTFMGEVREQKPVLMRGRPETAVRYLRMLLRGGKKRSRRRLTQPDWTRHCQSHLVHFISCFHESQPHVRRHLRSVVRATERLVLAGLPENSLHFTWYRHDQTHGTHAHGALVRTQRHSGQPFTPTLDPKLLLNFDRLLSRRFGYADPLDDRAFRVAHAAWGSWKNCNKPIINEVCSAAMEKWKSTENPLTQYSQFLDLLEDHNLPILHAPGETKREKTAPKGLMVPRYPNTVAVLVTGEGEHPDRIICFKGPACRADFKPKPWWEEIERRKHKVAELLKPEGHEKLLNKFSEGLMQRIKKQREAHRVPPSGGDSDASYFMQLLGDTSEQREEDIHARGGRDGAGELPLFDPQHMDWGERHYAFVSFDDPDFVPGLDASDPKGGIHPEPAPGLDATDPKGGTHPEPAPKLDATDPRYGSLRNQIAQELELLEDEPMSPEEWETWLEQLEAECAADPVGQEEHGAAAVIAPGLEGVVEPAEQAPPTTPTKSTEEESLQSSSDITSPSPVPDPRALHAANAEAEEEEKRRKREELERQQKERGERERELQIQIGIDIALNLESERTREMARQIREASEPGTPANAAN